MTFKKSDTFFWDITKFKNIVNGIFDYEKLKPNNEDILFLNDIISELNKINNPQFSENTKEIKISKIFKELIDKIIPKDKDTLPYSKEIKEIISNFSKEKTFYVKDIQQELLNKKRIRLSYKKTYYILKNNLNYKFLKTTLKNKTLDENNSKLMTFIFLKIFIRAIKLGILPIFLDESGFKLNKNNNYRWRKIQEDFNKGPKSNIKTKINLISAVNLEKVIYNKLTEKNTNSKIFYGFLKELFQFIPKNKRKEYLIIMDNATYHKTRAIIHLCLKNKIKVLTCTPYFSQLNMIEYIFGYIKNKLYKNIYFTKSKLIQDIKNIINSKDIEKVIKNLYKHTLTNYLNFIKKNNDITDLNDLFNNSK